MKSVELADATAALKDYAKQLAGEPIVITRGGKAIAALIRLKPADLESLLVSESPVFQRIVRKSRASYKRDGGLSREQLKACLTKARGA